MKKIALQFLVIFTFFTGTSIHANDQTQEKRTVLLTGAAGFIGSNFLKFMFDKYPDYQFIVLDVLTYAGTLDNIPKYIQESDRFNFVKGSVVDEALVDSLVGQSNFVVHFAAETHVTRSILDDKAFFDTDVQGTRAMMAALVRHTDTVERFIHISTSEVYGTAEYEPMDELHPLNPRSPYAAAKAGADRLVYAYSCTYDIPVVIIRPFNNYGPHQHVEKMIPHFITNALEGKSITVHGNGSQKRDWIYVEDTCRGLDKVLHINDFLKVKNQEINFGSEAAISVLDIAGMIMNELNLSDQFLVFTKDRPGQVECHIGSYAKAYRLLGWKPETEFVDGLRNTIKWYQENQLLWQHNKAGAVVDNG